MTYALIIAALVLPVLVWLLLRPGKVSLRRRPGYVGWSPGQGSTAPGVTYQSFPSATPVANSSGNVAAASAVATLPAVAGKVTYIEGFDITGAGATGASIVAVTVTGLPTTIGTLTFEVVVPAGATVGIGGTGNPGLIPVRFPTPLPASAANTTIVVTAPSFGTGNTNACVTAYGFQA